MRSIRRSLILYVLTLLAITLGVAAVVIDQLTGRALEARQRAASELIEEQYKDRKRDAATKLDEQLIVEARNLGRAMQRQYGSLFDTEYRNFRIGLQIATLFGKEGGMAAA